MNNNYKVEQIYYSDWGARLKEGHEDYWWMIGTISDWIGNSLEACRRGFRLEPCWYSTIGVVQTKEKFGECRIYVSMGMEDYIRANFDKYISITNDNNEIYKGWKNGTLKKEDRDYPTIYKIQTYENMNIYPITPKTYDDYKREAIDDDIAYYRQVYLDAIRLWPQYEFAIIAGADWPEYLAKTEKEVDDNVDNNIREYLKWYRQSSDFSKEKETERLKDFENRRTRLKKICNFNPLQEKTEE